MPLGLLPGDSPTENGRGAPGVDGVVPGGIAAVAETGRPGFRRVRLEPAYCPFEQGLRFGERVERLAELRNPPQRHVASWNRQEIEAGPRRRNGVEPR